MGKHGYAQHAQHRTSLLALISRIDRNLVLLLSHAVLL